MGRRRRGLPLFRLFVLVALLGGMGAVAAVWIRVQLTPVGRGSARVFRVHRGERIQDVAVRLRSQNLVRHAGVFVWYARWRGDAGRLRAGRYRLSPAMPAAQILDTLILGRQDLTGLVIIPEGFTVARTAERLASAGIVASAKEFIQLAEHPQGKIRAPFPLPPTGLEGYLFPAGYDLEPRTPPEQAAQAMVDEFVEEFARPYATEIARSPHTLHELVTIASLIEREAEVERDRPLIAGVIENRLKKGMRLQIDASVLYAMGRHKNRVLYRDLKTPSPYNTYLRAGLPPGPIASPGLPSLLAALRPAHHDYLFYVASPDGSHIFTRTEAEHNRVVADLRRNRDSGKR